MRLMSEDQGNQMKSRYIHALGRECLRRRAEYEGDEEAKPRHRRLEDAVDEKGDGVRGREGETEERGGRRWDKA